MVGLTLVGLGPGCGRWAWRGLVSVGPSTAGAGGRLGCGVGGGLALRLPVLGPVCCVSPSAACRAVGRAVGRAVISAQERRTASARGRWVCSGLPRLRWQAPGGPLPEGLRAFRWCGGRLAGGWLALPLCRVGCVCACFPAPRLARGFRGLALRGLRGRSVARLDGRPPPARFFPLLVLRVRGLKGSNKKKKKKKKGFRV